LYPFFLSSSYPRAGAYTPVDCLTRVPSIFFLRRSFFQLEIIDQVSSLCRACRLHGVPTPYFPMFSVPLFSRYSSQRCRRSSLLTGFPIFPLDRDSHRAPRSKRFSHSNVCSSWGLIGSPLAAFFHDLRAVSTGAFRSCF